MRRNQRSKEEDLPSTGRWSDLLSEKWLKSYTATMFHSYLKIRHIRVIGLCVDASAWTSVQYQMNRSTQVCTTVANSNILICRNQTNAVHGIWNPFLEVKGTTPSQGVRRAGLSREEEGERSEKSHQREEEVEQYIFRCECPRVFGNCTVITHWILLRWLVH